MSYILTTVYPSDYRMIISSSVHNNKNTVIDELVGTGYSDSEVAEIMQGYSYDDGDGWIKVQKVDL